MSPDPRGGTGRGRERERLRFRVHIIHPLGRCGARLQGPALLHPDEKNLPGLHLTPPRRTRSQALNTVSRSEDQSQSRQIQSSQIKGFWHLSYKGDLEDIKSFMKNHPGGGSQLSPRPLSAGIRAIPVSTFLG